MATLNKSAFADQDEPEFDEPGFDDQFAIEGEDDHLEADSRQQPSLVQRLFAIASDISREPLSVEMENTIQQSFVDDLDDDISEQVNQK